MPYSHCQTRLDKAVFSRRVAWCELDIRVRVTSREGQISTMAVFLVRAGVRGKLMPGGALVLHSATPVRQLGSIEQILRTQLSTVNRRPAPNHA